MLLFHQVASFWLESSFNAETGQWRNRPCMLAEAFVDVPRPHCSNPYKIADIGDSRKSSSMKSEKQIVHPGEVNRIR